MIDVRIVPKFRILFLVSNRYYETKMSRCRFHQMEAVDQQPDVDVTFWGNGWGGYDEKASVRDNLRQYCLSFDLVHVYKPEDHIDVAGCGVPVSIAFNECWPGTNRAMKEVLGCGAGLVICHHENDGSCFDRRRCSVVHLPHCAEESVFHRYAGDPRQTDVLLTGVLNPDVYPLRSRMAKLVESGKIPGRVRPHPGYRLTSKLECESEAIAYANDLGSAKIALVCSSRYRYALAKYTEAAMAGCLVIGDRPDDSTFCHAMPSIEYLPEGCSDDEIIAVVNGYLRNDERRIERAKEIQREALLSLRMDDYARRFVSVAKEFVRCSQSKN